MAITGSETLLVLGQNPANTPAASTQQTTTGEIAQLAGGANSITFTTATAGINFKLGANGNAGTVILTGTTAVTVSNTSITTSDAVLFSLATVGGTVGAVPSIKTITAATGFTVAGTVGDTSTYNYVVFGTLA